MDNIEQFRKKAYRIYTYVYTFSDKGKQLFWNLMFQAFLSTIFCQLTLKLNYYSDMVSFRRY